MKLFVFSNLFPPALTGSAVYTYQLVKALSPLVDQIHVFTVKYGDFPDDLKSYPNIFIHELSPLKLPNLNIALNFSYLNSVMRPKNYKIVRDVYRQYGCDLVVQQNHVFDTSALSKAFAYFNKLPRAITFHTTIFHHNPIYNWILQLGEQLVLKPFMEYSSGNVIATDTLDKIYIRKRRLSKSPAHWLPLGIEDMTDGDLSANDLVRQYGLQGKRIISSIGHIHDRRNRVSLIRAFAKILPAYPDLRLVIIGNIGDQTPVTLTKDLGLENEVLFIGKESQENIKKWLSISEMEAHWFHQLQTLGIATLETMSAGRVAITSCNRKCYPHSIIQPQHNLLNVSADDIDEIADKIRLVLDDAAFKAHVEKEARATFESYFKWEKVAQDTVALYADILSRSRVSTAEGSSEK